MSSTVFTDQTTIIVAAWMNDANSVIYNILGNGTVIPATVAAARTNLGLGSIATQAASAVAITGGTASGLAITGSTYTGNITGNASGTAASITGINPVTTGGTGLATTTAWSPVLTGTTATGVFKADLGPGTSGQVLTSGGAAAYPTWGAIVTSGTATATTSGTAINYTSIPATVKQITICFNNVSTNGASPLVMRLGTSGGVQSTGYEGSSCSTVTGATPTGNLSDGFSLGQGFSATHGRSGSITLSLVDASTGRWVCSGVIGQTDSPQINFVGGSKALSGTLDRLQLTTSTGADTFDNGSINILYQ